MKFFASFVRTALIAIALAGCTQRAATTNEGGQAVAALATQARGLLSNSDSAMKAIKAQLQGIKDGSIVGDPQALLNAILDAFPVDHALVLTALDTFLAGAEGKLSDSALQSFQELRGKLAAPPNAPSGLRRTLLGELPSAAIKALLDSVRAFDPSKVDELIKNAEDMIQAMENLIDALKKAEAELLLAPHAAAPPMLPGVGRLFGPTSCPAITDKFPGGWVPEPVACSVFADLKLCLKNDKEKQCAKRCDPAHPPAGMRCAPELSEVEEVSCAAPPARWAGVCGGLNGNTTASCYDAMGQLVDQFPIGFYVCKNLPFVPEPAAPADPADPGGASDPAPPIEPAEGDFDDLK